MPNIQFHPIRISHRDALWELAKASSESLNPEFHDAIKLSALQVGQGWGEIAAEGEAWLGYYFILPSFLECELVHVFVNPAFKGKEIESMLLKQAISSVKKAGLHDELLFFADDTEKSWLQELGFVPALRAHKTSSHRVLPKSSQGQWFQVKVS